jgi:hypothetical protein
MSDVSAEVPAYGVALFDNPNELGAGWACLANRSPIRFAAPVDLSNEAIWITSVRYDEFIRRGKSMHNLRRIDYFRTSLTQIAGDLGLRITRENGTQTAPVLSVIAQNAICLAVRLYKMENPLIDLREDQLQDDLRRILPHAPKPQKHMLASLMSAHQAFSSPAWPKEYESDLVTVSIRYNRLEYARKIMATPVPDESWMLGAPTSRGLDDFLDPSRPCMVEATVELSSTNPDIGALVAFGASPGRKTGVRKWISQPELMWLHRHAQVHVERVYYTAGAKPLPPSAQLSPLLGDPLLDLSYSAGLVAEAHWSALCSTSYNRATRTNEVTTWAVWLRAMDRALSFSLALAAYEAGFKAFGYGNGGAILSVKRSDLGRLLDFCQEHGVSYPTFSGLAREHDFEF